MTSDLNAAELERRLADELGDAEVAASTIDRLDEDTVERLLTAADDIATSPLLCYRPALRAAEEVESLWILAFGNRRTADGTGLSPGPVNAALAEVAATFVADHPVPIIAQWETAEVLEALGVAGVISVEPDTAADGSAVYLSTAGVFEKGRRLADEEGIRPGRLGVIAHADHAGRCLLTAAAAALDAAVPTGIALPSGYDSASDQPWTRSRGAFIPVDLMARAHLR